MAPNKIKKAIGVVKDHTRIGLVMVVGGNSESDLEIAVIKATRHDDSPPQERHAREIICLTTCSKPLVNACIDKIGKRLSKTKNWIVALKTLMLVHRLLNDGDPTYLEEIYFARRHGMRFLNMSGFRDLSCKSNSWEFSAFVRMYAQYLDEQLQFRMQCGRKRNGRYVYRAEEEDGGATSKETAATATPVHEMKNNSIFYRVHWLKQLLERFLACRPTGAAKRNKVVHVALYPIVKESFHIFYDMTEVIATLIARFMQLEVTDMVKVQKIFCQVSKLYDELDAFYEWCKSVGITLALNFPSIEKISKAKMDTMDDFIWQKSQLLQNKEGSTSTPTEANNVELNKDECVIKALPPPVDDEVKEVDKETKKTQEVGDLLDLWYDSPGTNQQGDPKALVLFDGAPPTTYAPDSVTTQWETFNDSSETTTTSTWEAFKDPSSNWETKFVQSATYMANQRVATPASSFDPFMLDGMYKQGPTATSYPTAYGTASTLALPAPAPPPGNGGANGFPPNIDPFAASLAIAPPLYMQTAEIEKKQRSMADQQPYWQQQQYARDGMPGQLGNRHQQYPYQYVAGSYPQAW